MITSYTAQLPVDDFGLNVSKVKYSASLAGSTDTTLTVPSNATKYKAVIKAEPNLVWVAVNETAAVPAGASFASTTSELVPNNGVLCRIVKAGDVLHFITATADTDVSVVFYGYTNIS